MNDNVVPFPNSVHAGNGAREALNLFMEQHKVALEYPGLRQPLSNADYLLAWLWGMGFKVVPLDASETRADGGAA